MEQTSSAALQVVYPLLIAGFVWIGSIILRNHLFEERLKAQTSKEVEVRVRLEILTLAFSFASGLFLTVLFGLSVIGLGYGTGHSWPPLRVLAFTVLACSLLSYRSIPLGTSSALVDSLLLGVVETVIGISSVWGFDFIEAHPGFLGEEITAWVLTVSGGLGVIIRILVHYIRGF